MFETDASVLCRDARMGLTDSSTCRDFRQWLNSTQRRQPFASMILDHYFKLTERVGKEVAKMLQTAGPIPDNAISMQIRRCVAIQTHITSLSLFMPSFVSLLYTGRFTRRGDSCMRWAKPGDADVSKQRPCYRLKMYVDAAMVLKKRYGAESILLSTESQQVIDELRHYPQFHWHYLKFDRIGSLGSEKINMGRTIQTAAFIEKQHWRSAQQKQLAVLSGIADLAVSKYNSQPCYYHFSSPLQVVATR